MHLRKLVPVLVLPFLLNGCASEGGFSAEQALVVGAGVAQAATLDEGAVQQAASEAAQEMDKKYKIAPPGSPYAQRLDNMTRGLADIQGMNFKVYLTDEVNAFAMPDGTVRVFSGLMDAMPDDQVAAVLQHEIGHVRLKHSYKQMRQQLLTNSAFQAAASAGGNIGALTSSQLGQLAYAFINARFSQTDEHAADIYAVKALKQSGKDPQAMKRAIETLQAKYGAGGGFLASHPSNQQRIDKIEQAIGQ